MADRILIKGGTLVDGTGSAPRTADVLIEDGLVAEVGRIDSPGARVVDADGLTVTPGWVDVHTHYDGQVYWDPLMTPSSWHGSTTAIMGNCGLGFAPARPEDHAALLEMMHLIEDIPLETLEAGVPWGWETFAEYLDCLDQTPRAIDIGALVPHGAVRTYLMGERGSEGEASPEDIAAICRTVGEALDAGAVGCSANRNMLKDAFVPGTKASDAELIALSKAVGARDAILQTSPASFYGKEEWSPWPRETELLREMSLAGNLRITFPVVEDHQDPARWRRIMARIDEANAEGARLIPQILARPLNAIMSLAGRHPLEKLPEFVKAAAGAASNAELAGRLRQAEVRAAILGEARALLADRAWVFDTMYLMSDPPDYEPHVDQSLGAQVRRKGGSSMDLFYDLLVAGTGEAMFLMVVANYAEGDGSTVMDMIRHPATIMGLGDGGAHCLGLCDVTTPTTVLTQWVRDRSRGPKLPIEQAVKALASDTARAFGLYDRGVLAPGMRADINLIDMPAMRMGAPVFIRDLPGNGRRLVQKATGYVGTFVKGEQILANGEDLGARPGRTARRAPVREGVVA